MQNITSANTKKKDTVSVIHLVWLPYGTGLFSRFISSYSQFNSGYPHELVLLFNGVNEKEEILPYLSIIESFKIQYRTLIYFGACQDIDAYFWAAGQIQSPIIGFFNSHTEFVVPDWLEMYMKYMQSGKTAMIGASGSWQSYFSTVYVNNSWKWEKQKSLNENFKKYKLLVKAAIYWSWHFKPFPNPHIRTNAFLINRALFLSLEHKKLRNKFMAYVMESGKNSLSNQLLSKGWDILLIDRRGQAYKKDQWDKTNIFWKGKQEDLLITDNQTRMYDAAAENEKRKLTYLAWGKYE